MEKLTRPVIIAALAYLSLLLGLVSSLNGAIFTDDFSLDTSANYTSTDTYGSGGAFDISGGTLNLTAATRNTFNVFHSSPLLGPGELVSVTVLPENLLDTVLTVSTTTRAPNTASEDGIRVSVAENSLFVRVYRDGGAQNIYYDLPSQPQGELTLFIYRETATSYRLGYDAGSGVEVFDSPIEISETADVDPLYIGVEAWNPSTTSARTVQFDNLKVSAFPAIQTFTASLSHFEAAGDVTLAWSVSNAASLSLNGEDVTGLSTIVRPVSETTDFVLVATGDAGSESRSTKTVYFGPRFSVAMVADPQYADAPPRGGRAPGEGVARLTHAVEQWNQRDLDWGVILGDLIDWDDIDYGLMPEIVPTGGHTWTHIDAILAVWEQLDVAKRYLLPGNHEFYVPNEDADGMKKPYSVFRKLGLQTPYYSFRHKGFRFITLMADWRYLDWHPDLPGYQMSLDYFNDFAGPQKKWYNGAISIKQRKWLLDQLDQSAALDEPVVILAHDPIHEPVDHHTLLNNEEMLDILDGYPNVILWMNGHNHAGAYRRYGNRHHFNLKGMQNRADHWYQVDFSSDVVTVYQAEDISNPVYEFDIRRPAPTVVAPFEFELINSGNNTAALHWNTNLADASQVLIERRHVNPVEVEIPSTATTLAWQTLATVPISATPYQDTPPLSVAEYKYRIRFLDGEEGSRYSQALPIGSAEKLSYKDFEPLSPETHQLLFHARANSKELTFNYHPKVNYDVDFSLSRNLKTWRGMAEGVDYEIIKTESFLPADSNKPLTKMTLRLFDQHTPAMFIKANLVLP